MFLLLFQLSLFPPDIEWHANGTIKKLDVRDASVIDLLRFLAERAHIQLIIDPSVTDQKITLVLRNISAKDAIKTILKLTGLAAKWESGEYLQIE